MVLMSIGTNLMHIVKKSTDWEEKQNPIKYNQSILSTKIPKATLTQD